MEAASACLRFSLSIRRPARGVSRSSLGVRGRILTLSLSLTISRLNQASLPQTLLRRRHPPIMRSETPTLRAPLPRPSHVWHCPPCGWGITAHRHPVQSEPRPVYRCHEGGQSQPPRKRLPCVGCCWGSLACAAVYRHLPLRSSRPVTTSTPSAIALSSRFAVTASLAVPRRAGLRELRLLRWQAVTAESGGWEPRTRDRAGDGGGNHYHVDSAVAAGIATRNISRGSVPQRFHA